MVTSYCPDGVAGDGARLRRRAALSVFYDLDTPVTLAAMRAGERPAYIGAGRALRGFDLVLSYTGGAALRGAERPARCAPRRTALRPRRPRTCTGRRAHTRVTLAISPISAPTPPTASRRSKRLFIEPARRRPERRFVIGGAQYPADFPWTPNIISSAICRPATMPPSSASSRLTLNVTRKAMAEMGWCPSGRLFEAAACGAADQLSDEWAGLDRFLRTRARRSWSRETSEDVGCVATRRCRARGDRRAAP